MREQETETREKLDRPVNQNLQKPQTPDSSVADCSSEMEKQFEAVHVCASHLWLEMIKCPFDMNARLQEEGIFGTIEQTWIHQSKIQSSSF